MFFFNISGYNQGTPNVEDGVSVAEGTKVPIVGGGKKKIRLSLGNRTNKYSLNSPDISSPNNSKDKRDSVGDNYPICSSVRKVDDNFVLVSSEKYRQSGIPSDFHSRSSSSTDKFCQNEISSSALSLSTTSSPCIVGYNDSACERSFSNSVFSENNERFVSNSVFYVPYFDDETQERKELSLRETDNFHLECHSQLITNLDESCENSVVFSDKSGVATEEISGPCELSLSLSLLKPFNLESHPESPSNNTGFNCDSSTESLQEASREAKKNGIHNNSHLETENQRPFDTKSIGHPKDSSSSGFPVNSNDGKSPLDNNADGCALHSKSARRPLNSAGNGNPRSNGHPLGSNGIGRSFDSTCSGSSLVNGHFRDSSGSGCPLDSNGKKVQNRLLVDSLSDQMTVDGYVHRIVIGSNFDGTSSSDRCLLSSAGGSLLSVG